MIPPFKPDDLVVLLPSKKRVRISSIWWDGTEWRAEVWINTRDKKRGTWSVRVSNLRPGGQEIT